MKGFVLIYLVLFGVFDCFQLPKIQTLSYTDKKAVTELITDYLKNENNKDSIDYGKIKIDLSDEIVNSHYLFHDKLKEIEEFRVFCNENNVDPKNPLTFLNNFKDVNDSLIIVPPKSPISYDTEIKRRVYDCQQFYFSKGISSFFTITTTLIEKPMAYHEMDQFGLIRTFLIKKSGKSFSIIMVKNNFIK